MREIKNRIISVGGLILVVVLLGFMFVGSHYVFATGILTKEEETEHAVDDVYFAYRCGAGGGDSVCGITVSGSTIEEKIWSGLVSFMSEEQAAGVMGNMAHEGGFNPARHETKFIDAYPNFAIATNTNQSYGIGLIQWSFGRRTNLYKSMEENGNVDLWNKYIDEGRQTYGRLGGADFLAEAGDQDTNILIALELCFLKKELEENSTYAGVLQADTVAQAAAYFLEHVEIPADIPGQKPGRIADAEKYYEQFHGKTISGSSGDSGGSDSSVSSDPCNPTIKGSMNINGAAVALAWPYGTDSSKWKWGSGSATDLFAQAYAELVPEGAKKSYKGCDGPIYGASCDRFVSTVIRFAGNDPHFATGVGGWQNKRAMLWYAHDHPDLWEVIEWNGDESALKAGDVVLKPSHVAIAVQDQDGKFWIAEAGLCSAYGHINKLHTNFEYIIRSKNAKNSTNGVSVTDGVKTSSVTGTVTSGSGQGNGDINGSAIELAWPEGVDATKAPTPRFLEVFNSLPGGDTSHCYKKGKSCSVFVNTVLLYAGAQTGEKIQCPGCIADMLTLSDDWEEIEYGKAGDMDHSILKPGDVIVYYNKEAYGTGNDGKIGYKGLHSTHVAIYVETSDGGKIAEAHYCRQYGGIADRAKGKIRHGNTDARVFRWKKQKGGSSCDVCGNNTTSEFGLKEGGMTVEEAKKWLQPYHDAAVGKYLYYRGDIQFQGAHIHDADCAHGVMNNCVALSQWFVNKYTTIGPSWNNTTDGVGLVDRLVSKKGFKHGTEPRPYAIFSNREWSPAGHTGVIMGVDKEKEKVVVAEASCSYAYEPRVKEYSFSDIKGWEYAYTDDLLKEGSF